ncbi:hypothetical protein GCM10010172_68210 [Paractinoplanes ferrugineus]|uniref:Uncharacterized protein n=1 Tax=Paractinoplanes ferrugineus TaxID=113564 RepID=A0A919IZX2_9ACTN|nr:hypothetical protein [Actinoplanes ferrugineus]GIE12191.1 hypothetical protein Afe05nite_40310 [Actinoplanes ferrugineus]
MSMTVSGLGTSRTHHTPISAPPRRKPAEKSERNDFEALTPADRELIFHVTGQQLGVAAMKEKPTSFAVAIANERAVGHLAPGQPVTGFYLKDLHHRYQRAGAPSPIGQYLPRALAYLEQSGPRRIDVSA